MTKQILTDSNGNSCSVAYFGSVEAAQKALDSLVGCEYDTFRRNYTEVESPL